MKKRLLCCLLLCCLGPVLSACNKQEAATTPPSAAEMVETIAATGGFTELTALSTAQIAKFLNIEETAFIDAAMSMDASRATPEAIVVLTAKAHEDLDALDDALMAYLHATLDEYKDYQPAELPKLEAAVAKWTDTQEVLVIGGTPEVVEKAIDTAWGGQ